jgi:Zinc knuckle
MVTTIERYCYNCASAGHLGDDCTRPRPLYVRSGKIGFVVSAFGEGNVPEWVEHSNLSLPNPKIPRRAKRKAKQLEEENKRKDDDDGWFGNQPREAPKPARKIGGIKLNNPIGRKVIANHAESRRSGAGNGFTPSEDPFPRNASRKLESRIRSPGYQGNHKSVLVDSYRPADSYHSGDSYRPHYNSESRQRTNYPNTRDLEARIDHGSRNKRAEHRNRFS